MSGLVFAMTPTQMHKVMAIASGGLTRAVYQQIAQAMIPMGFGWANASGIMRRVIPNFTPTLFADVWTNPYLQNRQRIAQVKSGIDSYILNKNVIQSSFQYGDDYQYVLRGIVRDSNGVDIGENFYTFGTDDRLTPSEANDMAADIFNQDHISFAAEVEEYEFQYMRHNIEHSIDTSFD